MKIYSIAVSGLLTLNLHALNNEGSEGNHLLTRQVEIVDEYGNLQAVNAISGDMFKHIQAEHLYNIATEDNLPLCAACKVFDANRIVADASFAASFANDTSDADILTGAIKACVLDDAEGILITSEVGGKKRAIGRKSTVEVGWIVGKPEVTRTESYFHVKFDQAGRGKGSGDESGANTGQNIFHRPASSGQYAVVMNADLFKIGRNDITMGYVLNENERRDRIRALLKSILFTFLKPNGAHRNTQTPHIVNFTGVISLSNSTIPAPMASALNSNFTQELKQISEMLNSIKAGSISLLHFNRMSEFVEHMGHIIENAQV